MIKGNIKLIHADCMDIMAQYEDNYFDLAIVDPPYGININHSIGRRKGDKPSSHKKVKWDSETPNKKYFNELFRVSKDQIIWGANYFMSKIAKDSSCWIMWDKRFSENVSFSQFEMAFTSFSGTSKKFDKCPSQKFKIHPTQKPTALYDWIYKNYAEQGQKILDTHLGSGSNAISAYYFGVGEFVGIELDKEYFDAACKRVDEQTNQLKMF